MTFLAAEPNEQLAQISNYLIYSAMAVYVLAFFAYIAEWTLGGRSKVARTAAALTSDARAGEGDEDEGKASAVPAQSGVSVQVKSQATRPSWRSRRRRSRAAPRLSPAPARASAATCPTAPAPCGSDVQGDMYGRIAISLTVLSFLLHAGGVLTRSLSVQRAPWGNMYEFSTAFSMVAVGAYLAFLLAKKDIRWMGLPLVTTVLLDLGLAVRVFYTDSDQLVPALHSYWLWIHVSLAIICGALFYLGFVGSLLYLFRDSYETKLLRGGKPGKLGTSIMERLPSADSLDKFAYRINAAVFPFWTFTIVAGAIWAGDAWGRYWGWDPKEVWSFITWVAYACYLHARATAGWKGRKAAYLALLAFACFLFNYYGVNVFFNGKHSYAGI